MNQRYLLALDQGTTSSRAVLFTKEGQIVSSAAFEFKQHYPQPGWVEHDPQDILTTQIEALRATVRQSQIDPREIAAIGITNQRETTLVWDRQTGQPAYNAIVWQCRRTAEMVEQLKRDGHADMIRGKTGLTPDAYFAATKLRWILDHCGLQADAENGKYCFGTVDSWLAWHLVQDHPHVTDATNASRTMLFNIRTQDWDGDLLRLFNIPRAILPEVIDSAHVIGSLNEDILGAPIPVAAIAGDQHAALFGQACFERGMVKNTYGTGCFMLMNIGDTFRLSDHGLLTTTAWRLNGRPTYALEGSVFIGGAAVQWLRDELKLIKTAAESEAVAQEIPDNGGVYLVPAFTGLGAPYWDMYARGCICGLTRGTNRAHFARAVLESIAYQCNDLVEAMSKDSGIVLSELRVDGGASVSNVMMQIQANLTAAKVNRPQLVETTALGSAYMAGLAVGFWKDLDEIETVREVDRIFVPAIDNDSREAMVAGWRKAVQRAMNWEDK